MIGDLEGDPQELLLGAQAILRDISPRGRVRLDASGTRLIFETVGRAARLVTETLPAHSGLPRELVRHVAHRSLACTVQPEGRA